MNNNNSQKNIDHFKKNNINQNSENYKILYCKNREIEITFINCLIFQENKLSTT